MNNFINRASELDMLEELYARDQAGLAVVYGRRRLGKTFLLKHFASKYQHCYFMASRAGEKLQINALGQALATKLNQPLLGNIEFNTWDELFGLMTDKLPQNDKFIFIIDEFQYLCQTQPAFSSIIQKWWDETWSGGNMLLVLCGSITAMMYRETLSESAPLYGRASLQLLLSPFSYRHLPEFLPDVKDEHRLIEFYSISGGVPRYMKMLRSFKNGEAAISHLLLDRNGPLFNEAKFLLHEEISSPNTCWSILHAIGTGKTKISELGGALSLPANQLTRYINLLKNLFLVYREVPVLEKNPAKSKKGIYLISDPFIRLWFGCIYPYESFLEFQEKDLIVDKLIPLIKQHTAYCFEELCRQYLKQHAARMNCVKIGRQWGARYEIDIAGIGTDNKLNLVGECKWSNRKVGLSVYQQLQKKILDHNLPVSDDCRYVFFSKSGFSADLREFSGRNENITLVDSLFD